MRLFISFSGGETSADMAIRILGDANMRHKYDEIVIGCANTSQEHEEWREFVNRCDLEYFQPEGFPLVWIEAVQNHGERKGASHRITDYNRACMDGDVFEDMIRKYGIPNPAYPHCTRELKLNPMTDYLRSIGWEAGSYDTAIGVRADEIDRMSVSAEEKRIIYPLVKWGVRKPDVNLAWSKRPFRLKLKGYQSNCKWCFKKSFRKHLTIISETPEVFDFPRLMEERYGKVGGEFEKAKKGIQELPYPNYQRVFFRGNINTDQLFDLYEVNKDYFTPAEDGAIIYPNPILFDVFLDTPGGCSGESCEIYGDEA